MIWNNDDTEHSTGGLYRWTMDALFGRHISPSRKFKEVSQDDTNYNMKSRRDKQWDGHGFQPRTRSSSASFDRSFLQRYELLQDEEEQDIMRPVRSPVRSCLSAGQLASQGAVLQNDESTDTFSNKRQRFKGKLSGPSYQDDSLKFRAPAKNDPFISKLFQKESPQHPSNLPGKFPSPFKRDSEPSARSQRQLNPNDLDPQKMYTDEYLQLLAELDQNGQKLKQLQQGLHQKQQDHLLQEASYREKYHVMRQELIAELKQSKKLYDNYYRLYEKYKRIRALDTDASRLRQRINDLEAQVVDASIEKAEEVRKLNETIFQLEFREQETQSKYDRERIRYQSRIAELESIVESRLSLSNGAQNSPLRERLKPVNSSVRI
ncbi:LAQU0S09e02212g1_1 [Lachancea quebecensis]|uniref:Spindle pole component BBP1 n=1 Tax=Lachancea quebecensis TaxID=1654605 RepID=A0A0P1KT99_9SACH|nr:LAQU0S09e02212g1_1 [Lachancea quebecensis]